MSSKSDIAPHAFPAHLIIVKHPPTSPTKPAPPQKPKASIKITALALIYGGCFLIMLWAAYHNQLPLKWLAANLPYYDKIGHVLLYCIPSYLGHRLCRQKHFRRWGFSIPAFPLFFALFTIIEELAQGLAPHRTLDALDLVCSLLGVAVGYGLAQRSRD